MWISPSPGRSRTGWPDMADFLELAGKRILVFGVANRRSVAWAVGQSLEEQGAVVVYSVRSEERKGTVKELLGGRPTFVCDVEDEAAPARLAKAVAAAGHAPLHGIVHSIAFANYAGGMKAFHETPRRD